MPDLEDTLVAAEAKRRREQVKVHKAEGQTTNSTLYFT